jgi:hypothetical protein
MASFDCQRCQRDLRITRTALAAVLVHLGGSVRIAADELRGCKPKVLRVAIQGDGSWVCTYLDRESSEAGSGSDAGET